VVGSRRFARYAAATLAFNFVVIAFGAFVRATGSGAGCGEHWPLCNGVVLPRSLRVETVIELSHRLTSGLALLLVVGLAVAAFRRFPRRHAARQGTVLALAFLLLEAAIGAGLVLLKHVAYDASAARAVWIAAHLVNTFLLLGSLSYVSWYAWLGRAERFSWRAGPWRSAATVAAMALLLAVGIAGAIVALGDTLFPAASLAEGFRLDMSPTAPFLLRLRVVHPALAAATAVYLVGFTAWLKTRDQRPSTQRLAAALNGAIAGQIALGILNLALLAPVWLQLLHLVMADLTWTALVVLALHTLAEPDPAWSTAAARSILPGR
jgi:heme A synthase